MPLDTHHVADVTVPTTFIWSTDDIAITRAGPARCAQHVSGPYRYVEVAGGTHWIPEEFPQVVADAVIEQVGAVNSDISS
ncbi:alpha/beta hydrolase [Williamsia sp.]|uniref:alpha/beta fold hydrolase n=1 Tax=Williamsia sp. TaxID=1872085 RepID=UPI002F954BFD